MNRLLTEVEIKALNKQSYPFASLTTLEQEKIYLSEGLEWLLRQWLIYNEGHKFRLTCVIGEEAHMKELGYSMDDIARFTSNI